MVDSTILLQFLTKGEEFASQAIQNAARELRNIQQINDILIPSLINLNKAAAISEAEFKQMSGNLAPIRKELSALQRQAEISGTALGRFSIQVAGSSENLKKLETSAYQASRQSVLMSQQLVMHPIQTLKQFAASTEKAAIAGDYFRQQLAFIASSRFGSIIIWGSIFTGIATAIKDVVSASINMDAAIHRVASAFIDEENTMARSDEIQRKLIIGAIAFGQEYKDVAEVMWELKSAGLSVSETYAGMDTVQKLIVSGAKDINMTTRLMAGLYRAFGDEMKGATTEQEKFAEIGGTVAYVLNKSQANLDDLMQSYKYAAGIAKATGVSFNELSAVITVANNKLLFGSTAGTGFAQSLINISKNYQKFARDFDIAIDPSKPLKFTEFLHQLAANQDLVNAKISAMGTLASDSNVRALRVLLANVQGIKEFDEVLGKLNEGNLQQYLDKMSETQLGSFENQWKKFKESFKSGLISEEVVSGFAKLLQEVNYTDEALYRLKDAYKTAGDSALVAMLKAEMFQKGLSFSGWSEKDIVAEAKKLQEEMTKQAAAAGDVAAILKLQENAVKQQVETFPELLSGEKAYEYSLLLEGKTREQQIEHLKDQIQIEKDLALSARNSLDSKKDEDKAVDKVFQLTQRLNALEKQRTSEIEKQNEKMTETQHILDETKIKLDALKTKDIIDLESTTAQATGLGNIFLSMDGTWRNIKEAITQSDTEISKMIGRTPEAKIKATNAAYWENVKAVDALINESIIVEGHSDRIQQKTKDWAKAAENVYKQYGDLPKLIEKAYNEQEKLFASTQKYTQAAIAAGKTDAYSAERNLESQRQMAEWKVINARTDAEELKAQEYVNKLIEEELKYKAGDQQLLDIHLAGLKKSEDIQSRITDKAQEEADAAQKVLTSEDSVKILQDINTKWDGMKTLIEGSKIELDDKTGFAYFMEQSNEKLQTMTEKFMPMLLAGWQEVNKEAGKYSNSVWAGNDYTDFKDVILRGGQ